MNLFKNLREIKALVQKKLRNFLIETISINDLSQPENLEKLQPISSKIIATPEVKKMPFGKTSHHLIKDNYELGEIYSITLNNAIYLSSKYHLLFTMSHQLISDSLISKTSIKYRKEQISLRNLYLTKNLEIKGFSSIFRSYKNHRNYYHSLIDNIPRIYLLHQDRYREIEEIKLLISTDLTEVESFFLPKILPENVKITIIQPEKFYLLEKFIFTTLLTQLNSGYLPSEYLKFFLEKVRPNRERNKKHRIFISRKNASSRHILNENELIWHLEIYGFKSYVLENLSIQEQIELFYDADYVIGVHGAGLVNLIFADRINVLEIFPGSDIGPHYYYLSKSLGHTYKYFCAHSQAGHNSPSFKINIPELLTHLNC